MSITVSAQTVVSTAGLDRMILGFTAIPHVIAEFAEKIRATAEPNVPVETGADVASLKVVLEEFAAVISLGDGIDPPYPTFQELGFHHWKSGAFIINPALVPAFEQHRAAFVAAIQAAVGGR